MKKNITILIPLLFSICFSFSQIPIEAYRSEIEALITEKEINDYWNVLYKIDQEVLLKTTNLRKADSISVSNMIKTSLLFDIHGTKGYRANGFSGILPLINLSHNHIGLCHVAYLTNH